MTPYYSDDYVTLYHGDCRELLPRIEAGDAVITEFPPYGIRKAEWDDEFRTDWMDEVAAPVLAVQPGVWNLTRCPTRVRHLTYRWTLVAHLVNGMTRATTGFGNWIPTLLYSDDETSLYRQEGDIRGFVVGRESMPDHPSPKPVSVMRWVVERVTDIGGTVIDPFAGSGSTLVAAKSVGRKAIGIEIEERYCEVAAQRCSQEVLGLVAIA